MRGEDMSSMLTICIRTHHIDVVQWQHTDSQEHRRLAGTIWSLAGKAARTLDQCPSAITAVTFT